MDDFEQLGIGARPQLGPWRRAAGYDLAIRQDQDRRDANRASGQFAVNDADRAELRGGAWEDEEDDSDLVLTLVVYVMSLAFGAGLLFWWGWWVLAKLGVVR